MTDDDDFTLKGNDSLAIVNCFNISLGPPKSHKGSQVGEGMPPKKYLTTAPREMRQEITQKLSGGVRHFAGKPQQKADSQALLCELRQVAASAVFFLPKCHE